MNESGDGPLIDSPEMGLTLLAGVRVVDFTQALSGPFGTLMLADLGADVIKVESPFRGDDSRHWGPPFVGDDASYFVSVNRNKRSVALNLKESADIAAVLDLVAGADVVIENWRPGTADRLGLGPTQLKAVNPQLIYCSISGFGQGQGSRSGYDQIVQGTSGVMTLTGRSQEPTKWGIPVGDIVAGMFAATAIIAALHSRSTTGEGTTIDISMQDAMVSLLSHHAARYLASGEIPTTAHNGHNSIAPYGLFKTQDGHINLCVGNDSQFQRMCEVLGREDWAADPRFATNPLRLQHKPELLASLEDALSRITSADVLRAMDGVGVPAGAVVDVGEVLNDPLTLARDMVLSFDRDDFTGGRAVNTPWKFDGRAPSVRLSPPHLGEHNNELLSDRSSATQ